MSDNAEQRDEVEFLKAMSRDGEFEWEEADGLITGRLNATQTLQAPLTLVHGSRKNSPKAKATRNGWKLDAAALDYSVVTHLPPTCLYFSLPADYPSRQMPQYSLSSKWLNFTQVRM